MKKIIIERGGILDHPVDEDGLSLFVGDDLLNQVYAVQCAIAKVVEREATGFITIFYRLDYSAGVRSATSNAAALYSTYIYTPAKGSASFPARLIDTTAIIRSLLPSKSTAFYLNLIHLYALDLPPAITPPSRSMPSMFNNRMPGILAISNTPTAAYLVRKNLFGDHLSSQAAYRYFTPATPSKPKTPRKSIIIEIEKVIENRHVRKAAEGPKTILNYLALQKLWKCNLGSVCKNYL